MWEQYLKIGKISWKHNLRIHALIAVIFCLCSPLLMGMRNLEEVQVAAIMERYLSFLGMILLVPLFLPDTNKDIRDLIASKKVPITGIRIIRLLEAVLALAILLFFFLAVLKYGNCEFRFGVCFFAVFATCLFQGGLGLLFYSVIDNIALAYMVPFLYYILSLGGSKKMLGHFHLFSFLMGKEGDKLYLLAAGVAMITAALVIREVKRT